MIEVKTILNANLVQHFNKQQSTRKMWPALIITALFFILGLVVVVTDYIDSMYGFIIMIIGALLPFAYIGITRFLLNKTMKNTTAFMQETIQVWRFLSDKIIFNESGKHVTAHDTQFSYDMIRKVEENNAAFYLYIGRSQAYILDAKGFNIGSRLDFHNLLLDKIGHRYKCSKKIYAKK